MFTLVCVFNIYRLYYASNSLQEKNLQQSQSQELIQLLDQNGSLMHFKATPESSRYWKSELEKFLARNLRFNGNVLNKSMWLLAYRMQHPNRVKCSYSNPPPPGKSCDIDLNDFASCSPSQNFGLSENSVCVFLKLRNNPSWTPQFYNVSELPSTIPRQLKNYIEFDLRDKREVSSANA